MPLVSRDVVDEPLDAVIGVGGFVDRSWILRPAVGAIHHVVALGAVLATNVLNDADVAAVENDVDGVVIAVEIRSEVRAGGMRGEFVGAVGRTSQQDRGMRRAFGNENHGVQVDTVAHRDHGFAPLEIERGGDWLKMLRRFAGVVGILRGGGLEQDGWRQRRTAGDNKHTRGGMVKHGTSLWMEQL